MMRPEELGHLIDSHGAALTLYARQWCLAPEDVVQEAFIKLMQQRQRPEQVVAWLYRVVRNAALSAARAERRRRQHENTAAARTPLWFTPSPSTQLDARTASAALQGLPLEQREVLVARLWGGLTFEQIGALMGVSSSAAHRHYQAGLTALRERLGVPCPNTNPTN